MWSNVQCWYRDTSPSPASPHFSPSIIPNNRKPALSERRRIRWSSNATRGRDRPPFWSKGGHQRFLLLLLLLSRILALLMSSCCCCFYHGCQNGLTTSPTGYQDSRAIHNGIRLLCPHLSPKYSAKPYTPNNIKAYPTP